MALTEDGIDEARDRTGTGDCVLGLLEQAARTIDEMWRSAQAEGRHPAALALGEASHGVHRALIALQADWALIS